MINKVQKCTSIFLMSALFSLLACNGTRDTLVHFKSEFNAMEGSSWSGSEYWSSTIDDWQITNDGLECLVSNNCRNMHLLSRQLNSGTGDLAMEVKIGFFNTSQTTNNTNWAGFNLGAKSGLSVKGDYTILRKGLNIGVTTNGVLFIGNPSPNHKNGNVIKSLAKGVVLKVRISPENDTYGINLSVYDKISGNLLAKIFKNQVGNERLTGNLALVSNFTEEANYSKSTKKSVWFKDWNIAGSKLILDEDQTREKPSD